MKAGREHYHAVVAAPSVDVNYWREHYGYIQSQRHHIKNVEGSIKRLTRYILKLTNHALKDTAGFVLYSRTKRKN